MSRKSTQATSTTSRHFGSGKGKSLGRIMTSETIADDIAAFKKRGGRIEILGNTPFRAPTQASTFRPKGNPRAATAGKVSARG